MEQDKRTRRPCSCGQADCGPAQRAAEYRQAQAERAALHPWIRPVGKNPANPSDAFIAEAQGRSL